MIPILFCKRLLCKVNLKFAGKTKKNYHDLCLKCNFLWLADVFEILWNKSLNNYGLCLSHYLSASSLGWNMLNKMIKVELELITDDDMIALFEEAKFLIFLIDIAKSAIVV